MELSQNSNYTANRLLFDDVKMFEFIFKAYFPRLRAFAGKFIEDRGIAEDIIQDVFLKVWVNRKTIAEETFQSYLFAMVRNACINHIKHKRIADQYNIDVQHLAKEEGLYYADFFSDPFHRTVFNELHQEIETIIQDLPDQTQKIFRLSRFEGMKNSEIAAMLNISVRTVEKHNTKALQKLKAHLSTHFLYVMVVLDLFSELSQ
jgi:RNA polymerase sigma-70 factor (ECF subfamily)